MSTITNTAIPIIASEKFKLNNVWSFCMVCTTEQPPKKGGLEMTFRYLGLTTFMLMTSLSVVMPVSADVERGQSGHRKVTGVVKEIKSELVTVETSGSKLTLNEKIADREGLKRLNVGEEYDIWVNENNTIIDVHPKGGKPAHSFLSGKLVSIDYTNSQVKLSTPEGQKTLPLFPETRGFTALKAGTPVTVEIGETGKVVDIHRTTEKGSVK